MDLFHPSKSACAIAALIALSCVPFLSSHAAAADYKIGTLQVTQPWARATPMGADSGAAYMSVTNTGSTTERLSCVASDAAAKCQIHEMSMEDGIAKMRPVEGGLPIKPGETVTLKPGGYHVMLMDLKHPLQQGNSIAATLKASDGSTAEVKFPILAIGAPAPGVSGGGQMKMEGAGMMQMNRK